MSLLKLNLFLYIYLQTTQRKGKKGDWCTGGKTIHAEIYIMFQTHAFFVVDIVVVFWGVSDLENIPPPPPPSFSLFLAT